MKEFEYAAPHTVAEATRLLKRANGAGRVLAGGTDLLVQLREGHRDAGLVVDVKNIPAMTEIRQDEEGGWQIGAAAPCRSIEQNASLTKAHPSLADAVHIIGGWQIKNRATLGGNLCTSSPAGDSLAALIACDAVVITQADDGSSRKIPVADFFTGPGKNVLSASEIVVRFDLPATPPQASGCYLRFIPRYEMDIAVVGCGASLAVNDGLVRSARIGLGAVAPTPVFAQEASQSIAGLPAGQATWKKAADLAKKIARPISDMRGPADYRAHMVGVLVERALEFAHRRIMGEHVDPLAFYSSPHANMP